MLQFTTLAFQNIFPFERDRILNQVTFAATLSSKLISLPLTLDHTSITAVPDQKQNHNDSVKELFLQFFVLKHQISQDTQGSIYSISGRIQCRLFSPK